MYDSTWIGYADQTLTEIVDPCSYATLPVAPVRAGAVVYQLARVYSNAQHACLPRR